MLSYLFFLAAAAVTTELPTLDLTPDDTQEIQELITIMTADLDISSETVITAQSPSEKVTVQAQPIIITNAIEPSMLEYKHFMGRYSPEKFTVSINGAIIEQGKTYVVPENTNNIEIEYTYSFAKGMYTGGKKISYQLNENITQANITFNWKDDWRVIVDNGKAIKEINA